MKIRFLLGSVLVITLAPLARADILFIDLNCSAAEITAARKAATARGEKLVLLPPRTARQQKLYAEIHDIDLNSEQAGDEESERLERRENYLEAEAAKIPGGQPEFSLDQLSKVLKNYSAHHKTFETVIISGHHSSYFFGQFAGELDESDIPKLFAKYPRLDQAVRGYYGWGCYTNTPSEADEWEKAFPNLRMTGGFDSTAPGPETLADSDFLAAILAKEAQLERQAIANPSKKEMARMAKVIRAIHDFNEVNGAVCTCGECVGKKTGVINLTQYESCDSNAYKTLENASSAFTFAETWGPPCATGPSELRHFYDLTRQKAYCAHFSDTDFGTYTSEAEPALHMIYMRQILANFDLYYADQIQLAKTIAKTCAVKLPHLQRPLACVMGHDPNDAHNPLLDSNAGNEVRYHDLSTAPDELTLLALDCKATEAERTTLRHLACAMRSLEELPDSWVEPAAHRSELQTPTLDCEVPE